MKFLMRVAIVALPVVVACGRGAQPQTVLDQPEATLPGTFAQVSNVVELRDGRVAFANLKDRTFLLGSFAPARIDSIGIHADTIPPGDPAPGKHKLPGQVLRFPGDSLALVDFAAERTTFWNEKGEFLGVLRLQNVAGTNQPLVYDTIGYGYKGDFRAIVGGLDPGHAVQTDSAPVLRFPREGTLADTVAKLKLPEMGTGHFGETDKQVPTIFAGIDAFGATPDGWVWVARATTNSLDWRSPDGTWRRGPSRDYAKVPVTQADKHKFMENIRRQMQQTGGPAGLNILYPFAAFKPPFITALTGPGNVVWLQRSRAADDPRAVYDVVGRDGRLVQKVQMPKGATVVGFGKDGAVYAAIKDGDRYEVARFRIGAR